MSQTTQAEQQASYSEIDCHSGPAAASALCRGRAATNWRDQVDGGDDPMAAGCHVLYDDAQCMLNPRNTSGDECESRTMLAEWTDAACHTAYDRKRYDCDAECVARGHLAGECQTVPEICAPDGSARCVCTDDPT